MTAHELEVDARVTSYLEHMTQTLTAERELGMPRWRLTSPQPAKARAPAKRRRNRDGESVCARRRERILDAVWGMNDPDSARRILQKGRMTILITHELLHTNRQQILEWAAANGLLATTVRLPVTVDPVGRTISYTEMEYTGGAKSLPTGDTRDVTRPLVVDVPDAVATEAHARRH